MTKTLTGKVAVVAGATRGAGRGIARMLGERGATVYCSGRSTRAKQVERSTRPYSVTGRPETIEETAELVTKLGGVGIPVVADHSDEAQVKALFERVKREQGQLDILVNDIWGGDELHRFDTKFWELDVMDGIEMLRRSVFTHMITSRWGVPLMLEKKRGLVVEITDGDHLGYRGNHHYDLAKLSVIRLAFGMAEELREHNIACVAVTPGFLRSEAMLEGFGVREENWRDAVAKVPHFAHSETPGYVGRGVAAIAGDPDLMRWTGRVVASWTLAREYGFVDEDGARPDWGAFFGSAQDAFMTGYREAQERTERAYLGMPKR